MMQSGLRLPHPCLVVLVGPSGSGKSTWARRHFDPSQVVSSDALRALVGEGEHDLRASTDAFAVLDDVVARRLKRRFTTVVDSLGTDDARRARWVGLARAYSVPTVAVVFDVPERQSRAWNKARERAVPAAALAAQWKSFAAVRVSIANGDSGFDRVVNLGTDSLDSPVRVTAPDIVDAPSSTQRQKDTPMALRFGLLISRFDGGATQHAERLDALAAAAESVGFSSLWVMDHLRQIPQVGRAWDDMLDSWTTLAYLAARTSIVRLGTMVTGVTYRNVGHLAKIVATVDVLSQGRAVCGIGAAWFKEEHLAFGWPFPPATERLDLLEDALQALPMLWGPGGGSFTGRRISLPDTASYPRPLQVRVPLLVGGGGEKRTLLLAATYGDAANVQGDLATVRRKVEVLSAHMELVGRDPSLVRMTHLAPTLVGDSDVDVDARLRAFVGPERPIDAMRAELQAGTVEEQIGRFRALAEVGVGTVVVSLRDLSVDAIERFGSVIDAFRTGTPHPTDATVPF
jgi:F420-dependent oxidoreductase-like protein